MEGRIIPVRRLGSTDEAAWRALADRAAEPNPLFEPDCVIPAAQHQDFGDQIAVAVAEEGGEFLALIPIRRVGRWSGLPYPWVVTKVRRMTYCGTPLLDPARGKDGMAAILDVLARRPGLRSGRILVMEELAEGGVADRALEQAAAATGRVLCRYDSWERPHLHRRPEATYNSGHTKKDLSNLARLRRKLRARLGTDVCFADRSADPAAVDEIIRLEAAGYKGKTGVAMTTVPGESEYFRAMCDRFREQGRLCVYTLQAGDVVCAVVMFLRAAEGLFMIKVGYDEELARSSPGLQLHLDLINHFHAQPDLKWIDVCTYKDNETLLRMYPDRKRFTSVLVPLSGNPVDRLAIWTYRAADPVHQRLAAIRRSLRPKTPVGNGRRSSSAAPPTPTVHRPATCRRPSTEHRLDAATSARQMAAVCRARTSRAIVNLYR